MNMEEILKLILGSTGALVLLVVAVQWLNRDRDKLLSALNDERNNRIKVLEDASKRCADDRLQMHQKMDVLQGEVRELYKRMIGSKDSNKCAGQCLGVDQHD